MNADKIKDFHHKLREATGILALNISYADDNYKTSDVGIALKRLQDAFTNYDNELWAELRERNK